MNLYKNIQEQKKHTGTNTTVFFHTYLHLWTDKSSNFTNNSVCSDENEGLRDEDEGFSDEDEAAVKKTGSQ